MALADWNPRAGSADADLLPELGRLSARARDLARNNGLMAGVRQTYSDNIIGNILRLSCQPDYRLLGWDREQARAWGNQVEALFRSWADTTECDAAGTLTLLGLTVQALGSALVNGDALALPVYTERAGARWRTRLMAIEADRLATPPILQSDAHMRAGIRFDRWGAPQSYTFLRRHPGELHTLGDGGDLLGFETIPAFTAWGRRRVLHLHDKERTGQSRGKPIVSSVMAEFRMAGEYASNELQASVSNSLVAAFLESNLDAESAAALFGQDPDATWSESVQGFRERIVRVSGGGAIIPLPTGAKLSSFNPGRPNPSFEAFMLATLRHIAAGLNLPYELLAKDFSRTNYSSARAALLEAWRFFMGRRRWLTDMWLRPIFELWLEEAVDKGLVPAPDFYAQRYAYTRCRFVFGGRGWVDPVKEAEAARMRIEAGLSTLEIECAEQGHDVEEIMDQRSIERAMLAERGLPESPASAVASSPARAQADAEHEDPKEGNA